MFRLNEFSLPKNFRGASAAKVQLWWLVHSILFKTSPQFMYSWRRFLLRMFGAKIGKKVIIRPSVNITYPWKLTIGDYSWIGDNVDLYTLGEIFIGENSIISQKSYLCTGSHDYHSITFDIYQKPISIGNSVWIASDVFIAPGVTIYDNCVVGARSSVFHDIKTNTINIGSPCKFVKMKQMHTCSVNS